MSNDLKKRKCVSQQDVLSCKTCESSLPFPPKPIIQYSTTSRILIAGHAPGKRAHDSGIAFDDDSGVRLRRWLGVTQEAFYQPDNFSILPMGFCYPGKGKSGDLPPRNECAKQWRNSLLEQMTELQLTILLGKHAIKYHLPNLRSCSITKIVKDSIQLPENIVVLPHPSARNNPWISKNPWFDDEVIPKLQSKIRALLID